MRGGAAMNGISGRKLTWGICIAGIAIAIISFFFLPEIIPVHFAGNGAADDFGNKSAPLYNMDENFRKEAHIRSYA